MSEQTILEGDCLEVMRGFADKSFDLVLTDPPYGIAYNNDDLNRKSNASYDDIENDSGEIDYAALIVELQRVAKRVIIFGALNFLPAIPYKGVWICWDKRTTVLADKVFGSPYEMAWCDKQGGYDKIYRIMHGGVINNDGANQPRLHPTQKPVELMRRIVNDFTKESDSILDPFAGSGTTGVAAKQLNRDCTLIEISPKYIETIKSRLSQESLF